ncbi:MAG: hypothetical protein KDE09_10825 [Anaerolineales bacterium]|nr:hypothetical protein [Anaerolineales bacterium]MCB8961345.1 lipopolysaccharide biosynthesis protein [Ardenticatenales bacterium]MCB0005088.1 hypothetical protein [Anaerolineales bacterium]MCB0010612.1 hypothetical protein [Anaerolineales bacterium]MCB0018273.1 hypothetical protein [Anaerolineales bacterium]
MVRLVLLRLLESYFRHRWLYLVPILILTTVGIVTAALAKEQYLSSGVMYVQEESYLASVTGVRTEGFDWLTPATRTTREINDLLQTDTFVRGVIAQTSLESRMSGSTRLVLQTMSDVREAIRATEQGDNQLWVLATWENPAVAYELANATIENYIQWHINTDLQDSIAAEAFFFDLIESYRQDLIVANQALETYLAEHPVPLRGERTELETLEISRLQSDINLAAARYSQALNSEEVSRLATVQTESDVRQTYFVLDAPEIPTDSERSLRSLALNVMVFAAVGVLLSLGALVANALIDRSYRFPIDAWHTLDLPVLAMVPDVTPKQKRQWGRRKVSEPTRQPVAPEPGLSPVFQPETTPVTQQQQTGGGATAVMAAADTGNGELSDLLWGSAQGEEATPQPALSTAED